MNVSDAHETRQIRDSQCGRKVLPCRIVRTMRSTGQEADDGRCEGEYEDDQESADVVPKCYGLGESGYGDASNEPGSNKTDPPGGHKANLRDENPRGQPEIRIVKLRELQAGKILIGNRVGNLVVNNPVQTRKQGPRAVFARGQPEIRIVKLRELQAGKILIGNRVGNLVVNNPVQTRQDGPEDGISQHGWKPGPTDLWV